MSVTRRDFLIVSGAACITVAASPSLASPSQTGPYDGPPLVEEGDFRGLGGESFAAAQQRAFLTRTPESFRLFGEGDLDA